MRATLALCALFVCVAVSSFAQAGGGVRGQVLDSSGASIPAANIMVTRGNDVAKAAQSDESGAFVVPGLAAGEYTVRITAVGFAAMERKVNVRAGEMAAVEAQLAVALERQQVTVAAQAQVDVDPANNASALVLKDDDLNILSDNPGDLGADLQALAGPSSGPNGGQIFIDGFSNGQLPPKESIREVRMNSNPFSAEYDRSGMGRIEIFTKPGTDKLRGSAMFNFSDSAFNARNPFAPSKPETQQRQYQGNLGGPIGKKASFTVDAFHVTQADSALVNAQILNASFEPVGVVENVLTPRRTTMVSPRVDYAATPTLTLQGRYSVNRNVSENTSVGGFTLASRAIDSEIESHTAQFSATKIFGTRLINETRFQYSRSRFDMIGDGSSPSINVLSSFNGGGATLLSNYNVNENFELHNNSSYVRGRHVARFGVRVRRANVDSYSTSGYNGSYTFTSMESYLTTLRGIAQGLPFDQIKLLGGGPRQYSVTGGVPLTTVSLTDVAPFIQDDWRLKPNLTLSLGLRYEIQSNISNRDAWAPRVGIAWGVGKGQAGGRPPKTVLRLGWGVFYERVSQSLTLQTLRQNGVTQQN
ncbi:MAG TPA: TonB-dependent receptor, partial [Bryobacteraceae bacterium]|nr:TonB-dependent receptor [Bryobacteraceae bacterium]